MDFPDSVSSPRQKDNRYLGILDADDGATDAETLKQFGIARALAALVFVEEGHDADALLESVYELAVISDETERALMGEMSAVLEIVNSRW